MPKEAGKISIFIGVLGMIITLAGTFFAHNTFEQEVAFFVGALLLWGTAILDKQRMYTVLESIIVLGTLLAFWEGINTFERYASMIIPAILAIGYLIKVGHYKADPWGALASVGLIFTALGFATETSHSAALFHGFLIASSVLLATYSLIRAIKYRDSIIWIWVVLNVFFGLNVILSL